MDCLLHAWAEPLEEGRFRERGALHVQSMSHWAPANIGPYSQAVRVRTETKWRKSPKASARLRFRLGGWSFDTEESANTLSF